MKKNEKLFVISALLMILGLIFSFGSAWIGNKIADIWLRSRGGSADPFVYEYHMHAYSSGFLYIGSILFGVGLSALLYSWYKIQKD